MLCPEINLHRIYIDLSIPIIIKRVIRKNKKLAGIKMDATGTGLVIHYHKWRNVEVREVHDCFEALPEDAFAGVKKGDILWKSSELYAHSVGKVYGYERIKITSVRQTDHETEVDYTGNIVSGVSTLEPHTFFILADADGLAALVEEHGNKITHLHDPQYDEQLATARKKFEGRWDAKGLPR